MTAATSRDAQTLRAAYIAMESITRFVIVPLAVASLLTGLVMSLGTKWGLFRHYWVPISLVLTVAATAVLLVETGAISLLADMPADPTTSVEDLRAMPSTLVHSVGGTVVLLVVLVLNTYKPQGLTRYGWRKLQAERTGAGSCCPDACDNLSAGSSEPEAADVTARMASWASQDRCRARAAGLTP